MKENVIKIISCVLVIALGAFLLMQDKVDANAAEISVEETINKIDKAAEPYMEMIESIADEYSITPEFIEALIWKESRFIPDATSSSGAKGLCQVLERYHISRMNKLLIEDLYDPYSNILCGTDILYELFEKYEDCYLVLMCFNQGEFSGAKEQWANGNYSKYAIDIVAWSDALQEKHNTQSDLNEDDYDMIEYSDYIVDDITLKESEQYEASYILNEYTNGKANKEESRNYAIDIVVLSDTIQKTPTTQYVLNENATNTDIEIENSGEYKLSDYTQNIVILGDYFFIAIPYQYRTDRKNLFTVALA